MTIHERSNVPRIAPAGRFARQERNNEAVVEVFVFESDNERRTASRHSEEETENKEGR
jgi:hypothetical protein